MVTLRQWRDVLTGNRTRVRRIYLPLAVRYWRQACPTTPALHRMPVDAPPLNHVNQSTTTLDRHLPVQELDHRFQPVSAEKLAIGSGRLALRVHLSDTLEEMKNARSA